MTPSGGKTRMTASGAALALASRLGTALGGKHVAVEDMVDTNLLGGFVAGVRHDGTVPPTGRSSPQTSGRRFWLRGSCS